MLERGGSGKVNLNLSGDLELKFYWGTIQGLEYERDIILKLA